MVRTLYTTPDCVLIRGCELTGIKSTGRSDGGALEIRTSELRLVDSTFSGCEALQYYGGGFYVACKMIFLRCCGRFCSALVGTFFAIERNVAGPHELSQGTMFCCGFTEMAPIKNERSNAGIYVGREVVPFFNHFNISHNMLYPTGDAVSSARGVAIYALGTGAGFNCSYLTLVNNTGNGIVDCGDGVRVQTPNPPVFKYANIVQNDAAHGVVYATIYGYILSDCVFVGNKGNFDLFCSVVEGKTFRVSFKLTNCFFDSSPPAAMYSIVANVITATTTSTYEIGHLHNSGCPAALQYRSNTFQATSLFSETRKLTGTGRSVRTQALGRSVPPVTAGIDRSDVIGGAGPNGRSVLFAVTERTLGSTRRAGDSHNIGETRIVRPSIFIESQSFVASAMTQTHANTGSGLCVRTQSIIGSAPGVLTRAMSPSTDYISIHSVGSPNASDPSDRSDSAVGTVPGSTPRSSIRIPDPLVTVSVEPLSLGLALPGPDRAAEESEVGGGVIGGVAAGAVILITAVILFVFFVFFHHRRDRQYSKSVEEEENGGPQSTTGYQKDEDDHEYENVLSAEAHGSLRAEGREGREGGTFHSREPGHEYENVLSNGAGNGRRPVAADAIADDPHEG
jgi:hypothetical protein